MAVFRRDERQASRVSTSRSRRKEVRQRLQGSGSAPREAEDRSTEKPLHLAPRQQSQSFFVNDHPSASSTPIPTTTRALPISDPTLLGTAASTDSNTLAQPTPQPVQSAALASTPEASAASTNTGNGMYSGGAPSQTALVAGLACGVFLFFVFLFFLFKYRMKIRRHFRPVTPWLDETQEEQQTADGAVRRGSRASRHSRGSGRGSGGHALGTRRSDGSGLLPDFAFAEDDWDPAKTFAPSSFGSLIEKPDNVHYRLPLHHVDDDTAASAYEAINLNPFAGNFSHLSPPGELVRWGSVKTVASSRPRLVTPTPSSRSNSHRRKRGPSRLKSKASGGAGSSSDGSAGDLTAAALAWWEASGTCRSPERRRRYSQLEAETRDGRAAERRPAAVAEGISEEEDDECDSGSDDGSSRVWTAPSSRRPSLISSQRASFFSVASTSIDDLASSAASSRVGRTLTRSTSTRSDITVPRSPLPHPPPPVLTREAAAGAGGYHIQQQGEEHHQPQDQIQPRMRPNSLFDLSVDKGFDFGL